MAGGRCLPQPAGQHQLGSDDQANERMAPTTTYPPPLAEPEHRRQRLKVGAVLGEGGRPGLVGGGEGNSRPYRNARSEAAIRVPANSCA